MSPDKDVIHQFLSLLTEPWKECSPKGQLELRFLAKDKSAFIARFADDQLMDATDHIVKMNVEPPHLNWSSAMFRKRRTDNDEQTTEAGRDYHEVEAS